MPEAAKRRLVIQDQLKLLSQDELLLIQDQLTIICQDRSYLSLTKKQLKFRTIKAVKEAVLDIDTAKENITKVASTLSLDSIPSNGTYFRIASLKILLSSAIAGVQNAIDYYTAYTAKSALKEEKTGKNIQQS